MAGGFKVPAKVLARVQKGAGNSSNVPKAEPTTADEWFERATQEEESGDRWLASDLSKALRFYQRSYVMYRKALALDESHRDTVYNITRLLFSVYTEYIENEAVNLLELHACEDALAGTDDSVVQSIEKVARLFGQCQDLTWDLSYNGGLCLFQYAEELARNGEFDKAVQVAQKSEELLGHALDLQLSPDSGLGGGSVGSIEDAILPSTILDTCANCYRLCTAIQEAVHSPDMARKADELAGGFIQKVDSVSRDVVTSPELTDEEKEELKLASLAYEASKCTDFESLEATWSKLPSETTDKLMLEAGSYRTLLDRMDEAGVVTTDEDRFRILGAMDAKYRAALKIMRDKLAAVKEDDKSALLSQICAVYIEQADIALERSGLSEQYRELLCKNTINLLKNAMAYAKRSGGLRESVSGKLLRQKRLREAVARLSIIEAKPPPINVEQELEELKDIDVYNSL